MKNFADDYFCERMIHRRFASLWRLAAHLPNSFNVCRPCRWKGVVITSRSFVLWQRSACFSSGKKRCLLRQFFLQAPSVVPPILSSLLRQIVLQSQCCAPVLSSFPAISSLMEGTATSCRLLPHESLTVEPMKLFTKFVSLASVIFSTCMLITKVTDIQVSPENIALREYDIDPLLTDLMAVLAMLCTALVSCSAGHPYLIKNKLRIGRRT